MKDKYCIACEVENKKVKATEVVDNMDLCKRHARIYKLQLNPVINEDKSSKKE